MQDGSQLRGEDRLAAEVKMDFFKSSLAFEGRVEHVKDTWIPASLGRVALQNVATFSNDLPHVALKADALVGVERVKKLWIAGSPVRHRGQTYAPASSRSMTARTSSVRSLLMRSIARSPLNRGCFE